jgi:hypothetical protein
MIVYLEPLFLRVRGNEQLHDYVMSRGGHMLHVWVHLASMYNIEVAARDGLQADSYLAQPFTGDQALTSVEEAQRLLLAKRTPPTTR